MATRGLHFIETFILAAELGSLRKAANAQGVTPQAASKALAQLEQQLGVRLFHRTSRNLSLTEEGLQFFEAAQPALRKLSQAVEMVQRSREDIAGPLRIVGPSSVLKRIIDPVIHEFCLRHPEIEPDISLDDRVGNWVEDRVDVGFRIGVAPEDGLIARRLFPLQLIVCASPDYLTHHGEPQTPAELGEHRCSLYRHSATGRLLPWYLQEGDNVIEQHLTPAFSTNDEELELKAVLAGRVIGLLAGPTAIPYIHSGELIPIMLNHMTQHTNLFIYYGSRNEQPARTRAFIDLVVEMLGNKEPFVMPPQALKDAQANWHRTTAP